MGRPSTYTPEVGAEICARIASGESLRSVCSDDGMPSKPTALRWLSQFEDFRSQYARAKEIASEALAEEILDIADDGTNDYTTVGSGDDEREVVNYEHISRSKLRVDTRKWLLAKLQPKKYGDAQTLRHADADGNKLVPVLNVTIAAP